jgi:hypothetical protein
VDLLGILGTRVADLAAHPELSGHLSHPERIEERTHVQAQSLGIGFVDHGDGVVGTIHLHCEASEGVRAFAGALPVGLTSSMTRYEVRTLLGQPESSGGEVTLPVLGACPSWDRFAVDEGMVHVSYKIGASGLSLVTIMSRAVAPRAPSS